MCIRDRIMVCVSSSANLYSRVLSDIMLKYFSHIIVEYIRVRACVDVYKRQIFKAVALCLIAAMSFTLVSCDDDMDIQQSYPFTVEVLSLIHI